MSKITIDRALIDQALEVLTDNRDDVKRCESDAYMTQYYDKAISDLREALAQPVQAPVYVQLRYKDDEGYWSPWGTPLDPSLRNKKWAPEFEMRLLYDEPARLPLKHGDLDLCRQWFGCIQDTNPSYLGRNDYALAAKLYARLGLPIPKELQGASAHGIKDTP